MDISGMCVEGVFSGEHAKQLNMVICEHLFRQGKLDVAEKIVKVKHQVKKNKRMYIFVVVSVSFMIPQYLLAIA